MKARGKERGLKKVRNIKRLEEREKKKKIYGGDDVRVALGAKG